MKPHDESGQTGPKKPQPDVVKVLDNDGTDDHTRSRANQLLQTFISYLLRFFAPTLFFSVPTSFFNFSCPDPWRFVSWNSSWGAATDFSSSDTLGLNFSVRGDGPGINHVTYATAVNAQPVKGFRQTGSAVRNRTTTPNPVRLP